MSELIAGTAGSVENSREEAVSSIYSGLSLLLGGLTTIGIAFLGVLGPVGGEVAFLGTLVGGAGLLKIGSAARHLIRFGRKLPTAALSAAAGLGSLVAVWPVLMVLQGLGVVVWPLWFRQLFGQSVTVLFYATILLTLAAILFRDRSDSEDVPSPAS